MTSCHRSGLVPLLASLLLLFATVAAAAADAATAAPSPRKKPRPCCAALDAAGLSSSALQIPVLILTLPAPLPDRRNAEVEGRMCECGPVVSDDGASASAAAAALADAAPDAIEDEEQEPLVSLRVRGSTSARDYAKKSFNLNAAAKDAEFSLLGMPSDDRWALLGVQDDRTLGSRSSVTFGAYRRAFRRWAPRTRLVEVYVRVETAEAGGGAPAPLDYRGVYLASERVTRGESRVDVARFDAAAAAAPSPPTGGFLLAYENDNVRPGEPLVATRMSRLAIVVEYPSEEALANATASAGGGGGPIGYLGGFFDGMERALTAPGPLVEVVAVEEGSAPVASLADAAAANGATRTTTTTTAPKQQPNNNNNRRTTTTTVAALPALAPFLDAAAALDYFLITELAKSPDGYRGSVKMSKDVDSPLVMGPPWDYGEAYGSCCGFPIEGYKRAGRSGPGLSGGSAVSAEGWRFNICADPGRCLVEPADGTSQWFRRLWQDGSFRAGAAARWRELREGSGGGPLADAFFAASLEEAERALTASGAAARNYARWSAEMPPKAEEMVVLERAGGGAGLVPLAAGGVPSSSLSSSPAALPPPTAAAAAASSAPPPPPPAQFVAANLALKQWVLARLRWMDGALAAVANPAAAPDAYLRA